MKKKKLNSKNPKYWDKSQLIEKEEGEVVGLCFEDNNVDVIIKIDGKTE